MLPVSNWELVLVLATFPHWQHLQVLELESGIGDLRILCGKFSLGVWVFGCLSWRVVNVANVKISSSNIANFQLGIGIGIGNISTLATFTSV